MSKELKNLSNTHLDKFKALPDYIQAIQFDNSPANLAELHAIAKGKLTVDHSNVDKPILHIEVSYLSLSLSLGDWLVCKNEEKDKWTTYSSEAFEELFEPVIVRWSKYPETTPDFIGLVKCFGTRFAGSEYETKTQFLAYWDGERFLDAESKEDLTDINKGVTHFYIAPIVADPE